MRSLSRMLVNLPVWPSESRHSSGHGVHPAAPCSVSRFTSKLLCSESRKILALMEAQ
jgi:hypothetical protein